MTVQLNESYDDELRFLDTVKATTWLRAKGIKEALVWQALGQHDSVFVEVPAGTPTDLIKNAVEAGRR